MSIRYISTVIKITCLLPIIRKQWPKIIGLGVLGFNRTHFKPYITHLIGFDYATLQMWIPHFKGQQGVFVILFNPFAAMGKWVDTFFTYTSVVYGDFNQHNQNVLRSFIFFIEASKYSQH